MGDQEEVYKQELDSVNSKLQVNSCTIVQGCHGQGKQLENENFFRSKKNQVREI